MGSRSVDGGAVKFTVAIDGPAAAGKGTVARAVARHFGFGYLDTGLLYRAVGRKVLAGEDPVAAAQTLAASDLQRGDLRSAAVSQAASKIAALPEVRRQLVDFQRKFARREGGAVLDGRDIGTVICPDADVKLFVTASDQVRARRRWKEQLEAGDERPFEEVFEALVERDRRDSGRAAAPLRAAPDAVVIDTTDMTIEQAVKAAIQAVEAAFPRPGESG